MELSCPQNLFYILDKTPLGEAMLKQPLLFTGCSNIQFFNSFFVTYGTPCRTRGHHSRLIFCDLRDTMPCQRSPLLFPTKHVPREAEDFSRGGKYREDVPLPTFLAYLQPV